VGWYFATYIGVIVKNRGHRANGDVARMEKGNLQFK